MRPLAILVLVVLAIAGCAGATPSPQLTAHPSESPLAVATPTVAPTASPSPSPTSAPTPTGEARWDRLAAIRLGDEDVRGAVGFEDGYVVIDWTPTIRFSTRRGHVDRRALAPQGWGRHSRPSGCHGRQARRRGRQLPALRGLVVRRWLPPEACRVGVGRRPHLAQLRPLDGTSWRRPPRQRIRWDLGSPNWRLRRKSDVLHGRKRLGRADAVALRGRPEVVPAGCPLSA